MKKFLFLLIWFCVNTAFSQNSCEKLLLEMETAFEKSEMSLSLLKQYESNCYVQECEELCEYDALKIKYYRIIGEYDKAIFYSKKVSNKFGESKFRNQIIVEEAIVYFLMSDYDKSVDLLHRAVSSKGIDEKTEAKAYLMLAYAHRELGNVNYAIRYFSKTYHVGLNIKDSLLISSALNGHGLIAYAKGGRENMNKAIYLFRESIKYLHVSENEQFVNILNNIAAAYLCLKDFTKAEKYFLDCITYCEKLQDYSGLVFSYNNLAAIYIETDQWVKAKEYLDKAMQLCSKELLGEEILTELNLTLSDYYYHEGKYQLSRDFYAKYAQQELKRLNAEQSEVVIESQGRYDDLKRTKLINDLKLSKKRGEVRNLRLQNAIYIILFSFISFGIVAYMIITARRKREKRERKVALNRAALQSAENEKLRVSRELHDSMGGTLTVMNLLLGQESEKDPLNSNLTILSETTKNAIDDLRRICRDLYPSDLKISGLSASLNSFFEKLNNSQESVRFILEAPEELIHNSGFSINFYRIVQELTNNTLKYANATQAHLNITVSDGKFYASYLDDGRGIDTKRLRKGVGLNSIEERVFSFKGKLEFKSAANEGFGAKMTFFAENIVISDDASL